MCLHHIPIDSSTVNSVHRIRHLQKSIKLLTNWVRCVVVCINLNAAFYIFNISFTDVPSKHSVISVAFARGVFAISIFGFTVKYFIKTFI